MITREKLVTQLASITQQEESHRADLIALQGARSLCEHWLAELDRETEQMISPPGEQAAKAAEVPEPAG